MFRTPLIAALTVALLGGTALAQPANAPPADLSNSARNAPDYDDDNGPPPGYQGAPQQGAAPSAQQAQADRDIFCRRDAAARTGYTTPREAARDEQTRGTVGGTLGGAALGAVMGAPPAMPVWAPRPARARVCSPEPPSAPTMPAMRRAMSQAAYADAYYACMHEDNRQAAYDAPPPGYGYPPPSYGYYPPPYPYYGYGAYPYYPYYYGPSVSFGFGFGRGWGGRGFHGGGFHGGGFHGGGFHHR